MINLPNFLELTAMRSIRAATVSGSSQTVSRSCLAYTNNSFYIKGDKTDTSTGSVADSDPGSGAFLTFGSGIRDGKKSGSGSGMNNMNNFLG